MASFPALELLWTPTGIGSVVKGHAWPLGGLQPLDEQGFSFGIEGDVRLRYPADAKEICRIDRRGGPPRLWHFLKRHRCAVNGRHVEEQELQLHHRDLIMFPRGPLVRLLEAPLTQARSPALEAAIRAAPDDAELLHVYGDFLLDRGDPLGQRLARARAGGVSDDATWLDALAGHYEAGRLEVEWRGGLAVKAALRDSLSVFSTLEAALAHLLGLPVMRFLRELTFDVSSERATVGEGLHALGSVTLPETLTAVSLGDVPAGDRARAQELLAAMKPPVHVGYYREAILEVITCTDKIEPVHQPGERLGVGDRLELGRTGFLSALSHHVLQGGSHVVMHEGPRYVLARIIPDHEPAKVNGRVVDRFPLRDGDLVEIPGQLTARFKLLR